MIWCRVLLHRRH